MSHAVTATFPLPQNTRLDSPAWLESLLAPLEAWARRLVRQGRVVEVDPEDCAQEAVCRMVATYGPARLAETPPPVLRAIAWRALRNLLVDESRRRGRFVTRDTLPEVADPEAPADLKVDGARRATCLDKALAKLAAEEREFVLAVMRLDSVPAAQKEVGWPRASPYYHLRLILERLREDVSEWS